MGILQANKQLESKSKIYLNSLNACVHFCFQVNSDIDMFHCFIFCTGLLNILFILELNSEFRDFKLWDQKLLFKGFVLEILVDYF